jgi:hypothetical protein
MAPWTLGSCVRQCDLRAGDPLSIDVHTAMPRIDPLSGATNQVQVVFHTGDKVAAIHVGDDAVGSRWRVQYTIPIGITAGTHEFTVEANAAGIETDIPVHLPAPSPGSNNTGVNAIGRFGVGTYPCTAADLCSCVGPEECESGICTGGRCEPPRCTDGRRNGRETDVDCGGAERSACPPWAEWLRLCRLWCTVRPCYRRECDACLTGQACRVGADCASGTCRRTSPLSCVLSGTCKGICN